MNICTMLFFHLFLPVQVVTGFGFIPNKFRPLRSSNSKGSPSTPPRHPPPPPNNNGNYVSNDDGGEDSQSYAGLLTYLFLHDDHKDDDNVENNLAQRNSDMLNSNTSSDTVILIRGGNDDIVAGTKSTLKSTGTYWVDFFRTTQTKVKSALDYLNPFTKQPEKADEDDGPDLSTIPVQQLEAPGSTILPDAIIRSAGQRSRLIGSVMRSDRVQECAKIVRSWYMQRGYVLHSVTGATLHADNGTATLNVIEPKSADLPLDIRFAKLVPIDPESGQTTTMRKYKTKLEKRRGRVFNGEEWTKIKSQLNSTLVETKGRTNPRIISKRLGLKSGDHFRWNGQLWQNIAQSGIFTKVWRANPVKMSDGSVQVQVLAQESPSRNLEYGIQKSLYTGNWEGELDFNHANVLGGGETLGLRLRRGARDPEPSVMLQFTDNKFGMEGGYDAQLFSEYIALDTGDMESSKNSEKDDISTDVVIEESEPPPISSSATYDDDEILTRKGLKFNLRNPISSNLIRSSTASTALERTSTRTGRHETIASGTLGLGPFITSLPLGAKTSLTTTLTSGTRIGGDSDSTWRLFPYSKQVSIARQMFPILTETLTNKGIKLALETCLMTSTKHLPRHEANAAGLAARVRGYSSSLNGPLSQSLCGTAEIRVPVIIPFQKERFNQDGQVVLFGDWMFGISKKERIISAKGTDNGVHKSSIGIGLRKSIQGIPIKYDMSVSKEGKLGAFFGLGHDWTID